MTTCFFCGESASKKLVLGDKFTARSRAKNPFSNLICDKCNFAITTSAWYYNESKQAWSKVFARCWSWLESTTEKYPVFTFGESPHGDNLPVATKIPTRELIKKWIIDPPEPPFSICLATSGQKHTYPFRHIAYDRNFFPVLLEEEIVWLNRLDFIESLNYFEKLMQLGFSKTEIMSGEYRSDRLMKCIDKWTQLESKIKETRATSYGALLGYVARISDA